MTAENIECNGSDEHGWNKVVEHQVGFEAFTDVGAFEIQFEEVVSTADETERTLEVCLPHYDGFICEEVEVDEEDMDIDFGFPLRESTARIEADVDGCGVIDLEMVLS